MRERNPKYEFTIFGRIDLNSLYEEWREEKVTEEYEEPEGGWFLTYSYVFENNICALLFENDRSSGTTYYRALFYKTLHDGLRLEKKIRCREEAPWRIDAIGINSNCSAMFTSRVNSEGKHDLCYDLLDDTELEIQKRSDLCKHVMELHENRFPLVDGTSVLFVEAPGCTALDYSFPESHDFLEIVQELEEESEEDTDGGSDKDNDEYDGIDGDGEDDDTECHASARKSEPTGQSAMEELNSLIGLQKIKEKINEIVAFSKVQKLAKEKGRAVQAINLNLSFLGNPGTAKTTVARIFARIMKENGLISNGDLIEVGRSDLVAKYTGQTAIKVKGVFEKAKGNVLFIDEAYSLVDSWENEYGDEAIATIVQEMENNRDDMIVIFAGYPDKMEKFLSRNPGLRSRVPYTVVFEDYSADELTQIAKSEAQRRGYSIAEGAEKKIHDICASAMKTAEYGNGRFSRNLVEAAIMKSATRAVAFAGEDADLDKIFRLEESDFVAPDNLKQEKEGRVIGFSAA